MDIIRQDGRNAKQLRPITIERNVNLYAEGSALIKWGNTTVLATASIEEKVPPFMRGSGLGWLSAEYSMLPRSTHERMQRDISRGKINARGSEIQRLIGRSLRAALDMKILGERTIWIDCDVLQADGGTRTASITAGFVALFDAARWLLSKGKNETLAVKAQVSAVSAGKVNGELLLDLCYNEDSKAEVDANIVMTSLGNFIEIQGTGETGIFSRSELDTLTNLAWCGISEIQSLQCSALNMTEQERSVFVS